MHYGNGTYYQLAYRDSTDTNPPTVTNLGSQTLLGIGSSADDQGYAPCILALNDRDIRSGDTSISFDASLTSNAEVQAAFASDAEVSVQLYDATGNNSTSTGR